MIFCAAPSGRSSAFEERIYAYGAKTIRILTAILLSISVAALLGVREPARADVIVVANRTASPITARIAPRHGQPYDMEFAGGVTAPIMCERAATVTFGQGAAARRYELDANSAYFFGQARQGGIDLQKIGLGGDDATQNGRRLPGDNDAVGVVPVTIAVDEEERATQRVWEERLRKRIAKASDILEQHCKMRLEVVDVKTWRSDDDATEFLQSLLEFEKELPPGRGRLVIGFTSQYHVPKGRTHLGGIRGPLHTHILLREWSQHIGEPERLELLVHELGHYFGAAHSPERHSVMRPLLGDRQSVRAGFTIRFDPVNALAMNLVAEEMRRRDIQRMSDLSTGSKQRLRQIYGELAKAMPKDNAPKLYRGWMNQAFADEVTGNNRTPNPPKSN